MECSPRVSEGDLCPFGRGETEVLALGHTAGEWHPDRASAGTVAGLWDKKEADPEKVEDWAAWLF